MFGFGMKRGCCSLGGSFFDALPLSVQILRLRVMLVGANICSTQKIANRGKKLGRNRNNFGDLN